MSVKMLVIDDVSGKSNNTTANIMVVEKKR